MLNGVHVQVCLLSVLVFQALDVKWNIPESPTNNLGQKKRPPLQRRLASLDKLPTYHTIMKGRLEEKHEHPEVTDQKETEDQSEDLNQNIAKVAPLSRVIDETPPAVIKDNEKAEDRSPSPVPAQVGG